MTAQIRKSGGTVTIHRIELPTPFPVGPVNAYLLVTDSQRVLVDCGPKWPLAQEALLNGLRQHGVTPQELTGVLLTHGHIDHVGLTSIFQTHGVPVFAHPDVNTWLEPRGPWDTYRSAFFTRLYTTMGVPEDFVSETVQTLFLLNQWNDRSVVDVELTDGMEFPLIPQFQIVEVPGHAQAAIALWDPDHRLLVCGDQVLPTISSNALIEPVLTAPSGETAARTKSLLDYRANLKRLNAFNIQTIYPGHGEPFHNASALITRRLEEQVERREAFLDLLRTEQSATAYQLAVKYFPRHRSQLSLIMSETIGYLDWLHAQGAVTVQADAQGVVTWRIVG
jgi:glyoxylase-like metal-dependent hydrolase (beta-lactamase superfamily II)